ncbi:hypothetical protein ACVNNN_01485 [Lysinibacillus fusiformis]|uniref:hypothetical protein n=1 Tax=Lysinibacillus sp. PWR01 TaxID=3342384 RepID=UPI00372D5DC7
MKQKNEPYVQIPNKMFAYETKYFMNEYEIYIFYHLGRLVSARDTHYVMTSVDLLTEIIDLSDKNKARLKKRILNALKKLQQTGYIEMNYTGELKNSTLLNIILPDSQDPIYLEAVRSGSSKYVGYTEVPDSLLKNAEHLNHVRVLIYTKWREQIEYKISYKEWACVLGVSDSTAVKILTDCHKKGLIKKIRGDYYIADSGEPMQEINKYKINNAEDEEVNALKKQNTFLKSIDSKEKSNEKRNHNWFNVDKSSKIDVFDMFVYLTTDCDALKQHAEKRIRAIQNSSEGGKKLIESLRYKANKIILEEKDRKELEQIHAKQFLEDYDEHREVTYKKKHHDDDISFLLDDN